MSDAVNIPVLVESRRGDIVDNHHRGIAAVADAKGAIVAAWGDIERPVYPRSAIKPLQTISVVDSGAADAFGLGDVELALACASHAGEPGECGRPSASGDARSLQRHRHRRPCPRRCGADDAA